MAAALVAIEAPTDRLYPTALFRRHRIAPLERERLFHHCLSRGTGRKRWVRAKDHSESVDRDFSMTRS